MGKPLARLTVNEIFISHSSSDAGAAKELLLWLKERKFQAVFLDFDPEQGIPAGRNWEKELYARLRAARAVIVLCSERSMRSYWCFAEITHARALGKSIFPVRIGPCSLRAPLDQVQAIDLLQGRDEGYQRLWNGLLKAGLDAASGSSWDSRRSPYPGLFAFEEKDAAVFFGREDDIRRGLDAINNLRVFGGPRLVLVLGSSGSGKSSLVRAGLLPRLKRDPETWTVVDPFCPRGRPFEELGRAVCEAWEKVRASKDPVALARDLREAGARSPPNGLALAELLSDLSSAAQHREATAVLIIDQMEELFLAEAATDAGPFLSLIRAALEVKDSPPLVIATIRSDFLGTLQNQPVLRGLRFRDLVVGPLTTDGYAQVIEGPAEVAGLTLGSGLTEVMLRDTETADALPLLAFTLRELWEIGREAGEFTVQGYAEKLGGLAGSVKRSAEAVLQAEALTPQQLDSLRRACLSMVRINEEGQYARRPARWADLPLAALKVLQRLVDRRLLVSGREEGTLEIAHEALLRNWPFVKEWLDASREFLLWRRRLAAALDELSRSKTLLRDQPLAEAERWLGERRDELERPERELIERSVAQRTLEQKRAEQRRIRVLVGLAAGLFVTSVAASIAFWQRNVTQEALEDRTRALRRTEGMRLTALASAVVPRDPGLALLLAEKGATREGDLEVNNTLLRALEDLQEERTFGSPEASFAATSPDGGRLVVVTDEDVMVLESWSGKEVARIRLQGSQPKRACLSTGGTRLAVVCTDRTIRVFDSSRGKELSKLVKQGVRRGLWDPEDSSLLAFSPDGTVLATEPEEGPVTLWNVSSGLEVSRLQGRNGIQSLSFSPDGRRLVTRGSERVAVVWDAGSGTSTTLLEHEDGVNDAVFDREGRRIVTASDDRTAVVWEAESGARITRLRGHADSVWAASFSGDGGRVLTRSKDGTARVWDAAGGETIVTLPGGEPAAFSPDASRVVTTSGLTATVWNAATGEEVVALRGHLARVKEARFSPDGHRIVTTAFATDGSLFTPSSEDWIARVWRISTKGRIPDLRKPVARVRGCEPRFSAEGRRLVTAWQKVATVWDAATGEALLDLSGHGADVTSVAFTPDGTRVLTASADGTQRVWDATSGEEIASIRWPEEGPVGAKFAPDGSRVMIFYEDHTIRVRESMTARVTAVINERGDRVWDAAFSLDGSVVLTIPGSQKSVHVWSASGGGWFSTLRGGADEVRDPSLSPDGTRLVTLAADRTARLWDAASGEEVLTLRGHEGDLLSAIFSPDGRWAVTSSRDGTARVWEASNGRLQCVIRGHEGEFWPAGFSGPHLITWSFDRSARVWDPVGGGEIMTLCRKMTALDGVITERDAIEGLFCSPSGQRLLMLSTDESARIWPLDPLSHAREVAPRPLSPREMDRYSLGTAEERRAYRLAWEASRSRAR